MVVLEKFVPAPHNIKHTDTLKGHTNSAYTSCMCRHGIDAEVPSDFYYVVEVKFLDVRHYDR